MHQQNCYRDYRTCGVCGLPVRSGGGGVEGSAAYRCTGNGCVKRNAALVDGLVEAYVLAVLKREQVGAPTWSAVSSDVRGEADAIRLRLDQLEDKYADGDLTRTGYLRNRDRLTARLADLERKEALALVPGPLEGSRRQGGRHCRWSVDVRLWLSWST